MQAVVVRQQSSKRKNWLGEVQGMRGVAEGERNGLSELCRICDVV